MNYNNRQKKLIKNLNFIGVLSLQNFKVVVIFYVGSGK